MSLKLKTTITFFVAFLIAFLCLGFYMDKTIFNVFTQLEKNHFIKIGNQIVKTLENRMNYYEAFVNDWSLWDDSYQFVEDLNQDYIDRNLGDVVLEEIGLSAIIYLDKDMNTRYMYYDKTLKEDLETLTEELKINKNKLIEVALSKQADFLIQIKKTKKNFLCVISPIIPSKNDKPYNGFMVMTVLFDEDLVKTLSDITGNKLEHHLDVDSIEHTGGEITRVNKQISHSIKYSDHNTVYQDFFLYDVHNEKIIALRLEQEREFNTHMNNVLKNSMLTLALSGILTIIIVTLILDRLVLSELRTKIQRFKEIEKSNDLSLRLPETGAKELKELARAANGALTRIENLNDEIIRISNMDNLTKIANRKFFDEQFLVYFKNAARESKPISILMIDIDYFKNYNDTYGHISGDKCLKNVAEIIKSSLKRPSDLAARYGGEEFVVMLYDTDSAGAHHIAEEIRQNVESAAKPHKASKCSDFVTVSIGTATARPNKASSSINLIAEADEALYEAKVAGRNRISTHS